MIVMIGNGKKFFYKSKTGELKLIKKNDGAEFMNKNDGTRRSGKEGKWVCKKMWKIILPL